MEVVEALETAGEVDIWACVPRPRPPMELLRPPRPLIGCP